jgi:hypothetical protein
MHLIGKHRRLFISFFALTILGVYSVWAAPPEGKNNKPEVRLDDLRDGKVVVVGLLGMPLHEMMRMQGTWRTPEDDKDVVPVLFITHVNGQKRQDAVRFKDHFVSAVDRGGRKVLPPKNADVTWEMYGYESYRDCFVPDEYSKAIGKIPGSAVQDPYGAFQCELHVIITNSNFRLETAREKSKSQSTTTPQAPKEFPQQQPIP